MRVLAPVLAVVLLACTASRATEIQPREGRSGLQGTGTIEGRQIVVGQGLPELLVGDCDPVDQPDTDVCIISDTVDGRTFVLNVENPDALAEGVELPVTDPDCPSPSACDEVTGAAVVTLKLEADDPVRATGGSLRMTRIVPFTNYVGDVLLELPDGRFSGSFDVVPRPE